MPPYSDQVHSQASWTGQRTLVIAVAESFVYGTTGVGVLPDMSVWVRPDVSVSAGLIIAWGLRLVGVWCRRR